jgi:ABC-type transporter Mla subunit MlaD
MGLLDLLTAPLRSLLDATEQTEHKVAEHSPLHETAELEDKLELAVTAIHRSADSLEAHIAVLEKLADSLAPLTQSVTRLTDQLEPLLEIARPLGAAERDVSRVEHLFGRHRHQDAPPLDAPAPAEPPGPTGPPPRPGS